ncbi:MAG: DUF6569 family protein [Chloroflexota bacterium]|nr:hypothetical protein [Dehalococcoidia bacterium]MDW8255191.1 DUF6569 family protein [Chloroflexota bacterium]
MIELLAAWLNGLQFGTPLAHKGLTLVPLYSPEPGETARYQTLAEAIAAGLVTVSEAKAARVPTLALTNRGPLPVFILDGEELVGGLQNRIVNTTLLVPARSTFTLPVSCVERGRWRETRPVFEPGETAYPRLRRGKFDHVTASYALRGQPIADQGEVWADIAERQHRLGARSATNAMRDSYVAREAEVRNAQEQLRCPEDGPVGVAALVGGKALCADIFDHSATLKAYWNRLVRSYALEALEAQPAEPSPDAVRQLLQRALTAEHLVFASPGLGHDVRLNGNDLVGAALIWDDVVVHTALFAREGESSLPQRLRGRWHAR